MPVALEDLDRRRLARTVRTEERGARARLQGEADAVDGPRARRSSRRSSSTSIAASRLPLLQIARSARRVARNPSTSRSTRVAAHSLSLDAVCREQRRGIDAGAAARLVGARREPPARAAPRRARGGTAPRGGARPGTPARTTSLRASTWRPPAAGTGRRGTGTTAPRARPRPRARRRAHPPELERAARARPAAERDAQCLGTEADAEDRDTPSVGLADRVELGVRATLRRGRVVDRPLGSEDRRARRCRRASTACALVVDLGHVDDEAAPLEVPHRRARGRPLGGGGGTARAVGRGRRRVSLRGASGRRPAVRVEPSAATTTGGDVRHSTTRCSRGSSARTFEALGTRRDVYRTGHGSRGPRARPRSPASRR